jgi:hypothetical protein
MAFSFIVLYGQMTEGDDWGKTNVYIRLWMPTSTMLTPI